MKAIQPALFTCATVSPLVLLALALVWGGVWVWLALIYMALVSVALDTLVTATRDAAESDAEFPGADGLLVGLAVAGLIALPLVVRGVAGHGEMGLLARTALFLAGSLWFGQVGHPVAHELIHRSGRFKYGLGVALYALLLFGHHASAHRLVHHRHVATTADPNSALSGEGYYHFLRRAWPGSFRAGLRAERALRGAARFYPYGLYVGGAGLGLAVGYAVAGWAGLLVWLALGLHFGSLVLLSDYVQHYGLVRVRQDGRVVAVGPQHSWNAPHWFSSALMLNAPRHSDHHSHPQRPYPALRLEPDAPMLPWPLPVACLIALYPAVWRRRMRPLVARVVGDMRVTEAGANQDWGLAKP